MVEDAEDALWIGSPGLVIVLADRFPQARPEKPSIPLCRSILLIVGGANPVSCRHLARVDIIRRPHA